MAEIQRTIRAKIKSIKGNVILASSDIGDLEIELGTFWFETNIRLNGKQLNMVKSVMIKYEAGIETVLEIVWSYPLDSRWDE